MTNVRIIKSKRARWRSGPWEIQYRWNDTGRWIMFGPSHYTRKNARDLLKHLMETGSLGGGQIQLEGEHALAIGKETKP